MPRIDVVVASEIIKTPRVLQVSGMFDVPISKKLSHEWHSDLNIEKKPWNVGLIVGPSGSGKTQIAEALFGRKNVQREYKWPSCSMIDDFHESVSIREITDVMNSVGFSTIPSWLKPFRVLSNGEQFRATIARKILEEKDLIVVDEFTSVVDRQVAKTTSHAVQKAIRKRDRKFIAISCHADIEDWLQPDWIFEPATRSLRWRSLRRRPEIEITISQVKYDAWQLFAPFHYMSAALNKSARCFCLFIHNNPVAFAAVLYRPISREKKRQRLWGVSRLVTLPDFQGIGLAFVLLEKLGDAYATMGEHLNMYPAHPSLVAAFERSTSWIRKRRAGTYSTVSKNKRFGGSPCGIYRYANAGQMDKIAALKLLGRP